jgi:ribonuclease P protein component
LIGRIHERRTFERLQRHGRRATTETLWCRYIADPTISPPAVAFSVGRALGNAVARNRLRRRLRAIVAARARSGLLPHGHLLLGGRPGACERSFDELDADVTTLLHKVLT